MTDIESRYEHPELDPGMCCKRYEGYICTLDLGHEGNHEAHGFNSKKIIKEWTNTDDNISQLPYGRGEENL